MYVGLNIDPGHPLHSPPLCYVDRLHDPGDLVDERDGARDVIEDRHVPDLLPGHGHVLQQLQHRMGHVLEGSAGEKTRAGGRG